MSDRTTRSSRFTHHASRITRLSVSLCVLLSLSPVLSGCSKPEKHLAIPVHPVVAAPPVPAAPKTDDAALLFPHHPGDHWVMNVTGEEESHQIDVTVKPGPDVTGAKSFYLETTRDGKPITRDLYQEDENGLFFAASELPEPTKIDPPMPLLKRPIHPNTSWDWVGTFKTGTQEWPATATFKLTGPDSLKTPGGEFMAFKLEQKVTLKTGAQDVVSTTTQWLAPKVGTVKQTTENPNQKGEAVLLSSKLTE